MAKAKRVKGRSKKSGKKEGLRAKIRKQLQGPPGPPGPAGVVGNQGAIGEQGAQGGGGAQGPAGPQGAQGERGPQGAKGLDGERGRQGKRGRTGKQGPDGEQGRPGKKGPDGEKGFTGVQGPQGPQGPKGERGPQGQRGPPGPQRSTSPLRPQAYYNRVPHGRPISLQPGAWHGFEGQILTTPAHRLPTIEELPGDRDMDLTVDQQHAKGSQICVWIAGPSVLGCPISPASLEMEELEAVAPHIQIERFDAKPAEYYKGDEICLDEHYQRNAKNEMEEVTWKQHPEAMVRWKVQLTPDTYRAFGLMPSRHSNILDCMISPSILAIQKAERSISRFPQISEIASALMKHEYRSLAHLRHIFVNDICNQQTIEYVHNHILTDSLEHSHHRVFYPTSGKYYELLGTRIGRMVGYLVLGGSDRGTRRISQIHVYYTKGKASGGDDDSLHFRFDLEACLSKIELPRKEPSHKKMVESYSQPRSFDDISDESIDESSDID